MKTLEKCRKHSSLQLWMWLVDLNYNFECDWLIELSDNKLSNNKVPNNKLSDNNFASELVENRSFFKPITIEEIVIFMIKHRKSVFYCFARVKSISQSKWRSLSRVLHCDKTLRTFENTRVLKCPSCFITVYYMAMIVRALWLVKNLCFIRV